MRRGRVLWVSSPVTSTFAGGERTVETLLDGLSDWDHAFLGGSRALHDLFRGRGLPTHCARAGLEPVNPRNVALFPVSVAWGLLHFLRHRRAFEEAEVIVSPTSLTEVFTVFPWVIAFLGKRPVFWAQNPRNPRSLRWSPLRPLLRAILRRCRPVFVSEPQRRDWEAQRLATDNVLVVPIGVAVSPFAPRIRSGPARIGFLGRMHEQKGVDTLLESLTLLRPSRPIGVRLAGDGPAAPRFRSLARATARVGVDVEWRGFVHDPAGFLEELDLLVVPSRSESFGLVPLEAWERGVPALTSDLEVFREKKREAPPLERTLQFRAEDAADLAARLDAFLDRLEEFRRPEHAQSLHDLVERKFSDVRMVREYAAVFEGVREPTRREVAR